MDRINRSGQYGIDIQRLVDGVNNIMDAIEKINAELKDCVHISYSASMGNCSFPVIKDLETLEKEQKTKTKRKGSVKLNGKEIKD